MLNKHFFTMKNCLFVGSFNPITKSHLNISKDLLSNKIVDYIYFLPVNSSKDNLVSIKDRINMIDLVKTNNMETLNIYDYNENGLFNYFILLKLNKNITHILMGSDLFSKFKTFINYKEILNKYYIIVVEREFEININNYLEYKDKIIIINKKYFGSSTLARKLKNNLYLDYKVLDYIKKNNLYN